MNSLQPLRVALVNDYEVIVHGLAAMLAPFKDRVSIVDMEVGDEPHVNVQVALFDTFGGHRHVLERARKMVDERYVDHVVLYTWEASPELLDLASAAGVDAVLSKARPASELVDDLEAVVRGERPGFVRSRRPAAKDPSELTPREQEVLALIGLGLSNDEIGKELFLGIEAVRTYARQTYRKLGVKNRTQAALRANAFGLSPPASRMRPSHEA